MTENPLDATALGHAFEAALETIPTHALEDFAKRRNLLGGGYRPGNPKFLRDRVAAALRPKLDTYDNDLAMLFRHHVPEARLFAVLTQECLEAQRRRFVALFGKDRVILALQMDAREAVRALAARWMTEGGAELPEAEEAKTQLATLFASVANLGEGSGKGSPRLQETLNDLRNRLQEQEKSAKKDRRALEEASAARLREMKSALATAEFNIAERQKQIDALQATLKREEAQRERRVAEMLSARQIQLFQGWLKPAVALEQEAASEADASLLDRAERALKLQAQEDRASAAHAKVRQRLEAAEAMLARIDEVLAAALVQRPELVAIREELNTEVGRLRALVQSPTLSPLAETLLARIHASTQADYDPLVAMLRQAVGLKVIAPAEEQVLTRAFHQRAATWGLSQGHSDKDAEALDDLLRESAQAIERRNPQLTKALRGEAPALIFLDGHNILNGLGRYKQRRGEARTHESARLNVEKEIARFFLNLPLVYVHLVWDGEARSDKTLSPNAIVHYSGGTGEHKADRYILDQLDFFRKEPAPLPMVVVTDDNGFAGEAIKRTAAVCKLHDFEAFLNASSH